MENKITLNLKENLLKIDEEDIIYINNNNECLICQQSLEDDDDLILINKFCKCYKAAKMCKDCFTQWMLTKSNECFLCREKYSETLNSTENYSIFFTENENIKETLDSVLKFKKKELEDSNSTNSDENSIPNYHIKVNFCRLCCTLFCIFFVIVSGWFYKGYDYYN